MTLLTPAVIPRSSRCFLNQKSEGVHDLEGVVKRAVDSASAVPGPKIKITCVYDNFY